MAVDPESALYKQALAEEAALLGIVMPQERYLLPIAEEALLAEPPSPWKVSFILVIHSSCLCFQNNTQCTRNTHTHRKSSLFIIVDMVLYSLPNSTHTYTTKHSPLLFPEISTPQKIAGASRSG